MPTEIPLADLDLRRHVRAGDTVLWGQGCAEPRPLVERLLADRADIGPFRCFLGIPAADTVRPEHTDVVSFVSYCGTGANRELIRAGRLDILPGHYSTLPQLFASDEFRIDVLLLLVPPPDPDGTFRYGLAQEYLTAALARARVVIAEVNELVPRVECGGRLDPDRIDVVVPTRRPPVEMPSRPPAQIDLAIARRVAELVPDGATLQVGLGSLPSAILAQLANHRDLGVHSGLVTDAVVDLMSAGVVTGRRKTVDRGKVVTGLLMGTERLFRAAGHDPAFQLRETTYTHDPEVLAAQHRFVAVNSALQVDLTGQINAEEVGGEYVGAVGGAVDFLRGARRSPGGVPVVALPATSRGTSRIVVQLSGPVSTARSDACVVVTEHGVADLRRLTLAQRRERMLAIAAPEHRPALAESLRASASPARSGTTRAGGR
ncbi:acetyl-CoA hydrolase/transferase family protein [Polymorphospora lycopeni]|uniref:Acetyl-CoA hydrolase/transferase C-terminal domain-containing protein n=1 Tax=Polymorphospora lycopeni TaxID=3140240 RepID=A0ABV5CMQ4_9ACTN